ncbi:MAG: hypothetical protein U7123_16850 [Potamolinea sp.]
MTNDPYILRKLRSRLRERTELNKLNYFVTLAMGRYTVSTLDILTKECIVLPQPNSQAQKTTHFFLARVNC